MQLHSKLHIALNRARQLRDVYWPRRWPRLQEYNLDEFLELNRCFTPALTLSYDLASRRQRAIHRLGKLQRLVPLEGATLLDVGCGHGELPWAAADRAQSAVGVDLDPRGLSEAEQERPFWPAARRAPSFVGGDAARLPFGDRSFDVLTSYWAMEHFADCEAVLAEFGRVLNRGGHLYMEFGPLFFSPQGHHLYRFIHVPWAHLIFDEEVLFAHLRNIGQESWIEAYRGLNRLTIDRFLRMIQESELRLELLRCHKVHLGKLPEGMRDRLAAHSATDLRSSSVTCLFQKA